MSSHHHKQDAPITLTIGIISASSTRKVPNEDPSGLWIKQATEAKGHTVAAHVLVPDDAKHIAAAVSKLVQVPSMQAIVMTGGTGISAKDVTIEALRPLFDKELTAFGALFAQLSYAEIGPAALLSRATAGIIQNVVVFCLPGSLKACKLACEKLILPELGHLAKHISE